MVPSLGPIPTRVPVDVSEVQRLIASQFPHWADLAIRPVENGGWDNWTFHLGTEMTVRLPSAAEYALAVDKEHRWLPIFATELPLPIPTIVGKGVPDQGYPHPWSVYSWLSGDTAAHAEITDLPGFAATLADFLTALQRVDPAGGPTPGIHNWYRGGSLTTYDEQTQAALEDLKGHLDTDLAQEIWQAALQSSWDRPPVWFHGDLASGNLLVKDGALAAVIDFGTCGIGDPACDLAIAWTMLSGPSRTAFRNALDVDEATWTRGRGWALWKGLATYAGGLADEETWAMEAKRVVDEILAG